MDDFGLPWHIGAQIAAYSTMWVASQISRPRSESWSGGRDGRQRESKWKGGGVDAGGGVFQWIRQKELREGEMEEGTEKNRGGGCQR